jgi:membrane-bound lytic murein transglycosylase D
MGRLRPLYILLFIFWGGASARAEGIWTDSSESFPKPVRLVPQVEFWKMVYTQFSSRQALIHDSMDLSVIYDVVSLPSPSWKVSRPVAAEAIARYQGILNGLATGPIDSLALIGEARHLWELWGRSLDPAVYRRASASIRAQRCLSDEFQVGLERSARYRDRMRRILRRGGVPEDLWVLTLVESPFEMKARSTAGAVGVWQITDWEKKRYMPRLRRADPRHDPLMSTEAVAKILRRNYDLLKEWPLAITAYNHGLPGMLRARSQTGSSDIAHIVENYDGPLFKFASRNYYAEFLAALEVVQGTRTDRSPLIRATRANRDRGRDRIFVGSLTSNKFHRPSCRWVRDIKGAKQVWFASLEEARDRGYVACGLCRAGKRRGEGERRVSVAGE